MEQNRLKRAFDVGLASTFATMGLVLFFLFFGKALTISGGVDIDFNFFTKTFPDEVKLLSDVISDPPSWLLDQVVDDGIIVLLYATTVIMSFICLVVCLINFGGVLSGKKEINTKYYGYAVVTPLIWYILLVGYRFENGVSLGWAGIIAIILNILAFILFWVRKIVLADRDNTCVKALVIRASAAGVLLIGGIIGMFTQISYGGYDTAGMRYMMNQMNVIISGGTPSDMMKFYLAQISGLLFYIAAVMALGNSTLEIVPTKRNKQKPVQMIIIGLVLLIAASVMICIAFEDNAIGVCSIILFIALIGGLVLQIVSNNMNKKYLVQQEQITPVVEETPTVD